jgi:heptosyltransferase-1
MAEQKFLVVRLGSLGDIVHTFPAVAALRESFPSSKIVWLTHPRWRELASAPALANEVWEIDTRSLASIRKMIGAIRREKFSAAIDYQGLWKSAAIAWLARVPIRIGFGKQSARERGAALLYTKTVEVEPHRVHVVEKNGELSLQAGATSDVGTFSIEAPREATEKVKRELRQKNIEKYVVLSPGGGWTSKCWPAERFAELASKLFREKGVRSVINCGPGEESLAQKVVSGAGENAATIYSGSFGELMAVLAGAECVVAGDTGPLHLADALGTRSVAIFGPTDPARNGPYLGMKSGKAVVLRAANVDTTYKREDVAHPSLLEISVDQVLGAMRELRVIA